ncbi:MAG TPA: hypothetical protein VFV55_08755 [Usitatibacteraceae bacterium]|nr:hypothetical protein [Usitatibacteraceae bacterium]
MNVATLEAIARALDRPGFRPTVPITAEQFADGAQRERFRTEKGMLVLNLYSNHYRDTTVDIFVAEPFDFDAEYARAGLQEIGPGLSVRFVTIPTLIDMKIKAGRPRDLDDVEHLRMILDEKSRESGS